MKVLAPPAGSIPMQGLSGLVDACLCGPRVPSTAVWCPKCGEMFSGYRRGDYERIHESQRSLFGKET